jgi:hypothetical protein
MAEGAGRKEGSRKAWRGRSNIKKI